MVCPLFSFGKGYMAGVSFVTGDCAALAFANTSVRCLVLAGSALSCSVLARRLYRYTSPAAITAAAMPIPNFLFITHSFSNRPQV